MGTTLKGAMAIGALVGLLTACGDGVPEKTPQERAATIALAQTMMPADTELAEIYEYSCFSCHANPQTGAPLTGDVDAWSKRLEKGMDVLMDNTINGFEGMPPLGMCMDCQEEQFEALIRFMSHTEEDIK